MKTTPAFKATIEAELQRRSQADPLFAERLANPEKNIDDCITYILNTVKASGVNGFADDEIYGMAAHYYDEQSIEVGKPINMKVVVNHTPELTAEEIEEAKRQAREQLVADERQRLTANVKGKVKSSTATEQASLF